jgi:hypothetical protein
VIVFVVHPALSGAPDLTLPKKRFCRQKRGTWFFDSVSA